MHKVEGIKYKKDMLEIGNCRPAGGLEIPKEKFFLLVDGFHIKYIKGTGLKNQKARFIENTPDVF